MLKQVINNLVLKYSANKTETVNVGDKLNEFASAKRILLLRQDRIGDVLISLPFVKKLREELNGVKIDIVLSHKNKGAMFALFGLVDNIIIMDKGIGGYKKIISEIKKSNYDVVVDLFDNTSTTSSILVGASTAKLKLGFDKENSSIYSHIVDLPDKTKFNITQRLNNLLIPFVGNNENGHTLEFQLNENEINEATNAIDWSKNKLRVGINLSGSNDSKNW